MAKEQCTFGMRKDLNYQAYNGYVKRDAQYYAHRYNKNYKPNFGHVPITPKVNVNTRFLETVELDISQLDDYEDKVRLKRYGGPREIYNTPPTTNSEYGWYVDEDDFPRLDRHDSRQFAPLVNSVDSEDIINL